MIKEKGFDVVNSSDGEIELGDADLIDFEGVVDELSENEVLPEFAVDDGVLSSHESVVDAGLGLKGGSKGLEKEDIMRGKFWEFGLAIEEIGRILGTN